MDLFFHYLTLGYLLHGIVLTLQVTVLGLVGGLGVGIVLAAMQLSRQPLVSAMARTYAVIFRGTPLILQMVFVYDALPHFGIRLSAMASAGIALAANEAPFIAEILRAGILGVDRGQVAAGQALGMSSFVLMRRIVAPQAIRTMIPAFGNETVNALKNSSLASFISVQELTLRSTQLASSTFDFFSIFFASGLLYLILTGSVAALQLVSERALDLDRPRLIGAGWRAFLPWRRTPVSAEVPMANVGESTAVPAVEMPRARAADIAQGPIAVEIQELTKSYGAREVFGDLNLRVRGEKSLPCWGPAARARAPCFAASTASRPGMPAPCSSAVIAWGIPPVASCCHPAPWPTSASRSAWAWCSSISICSPT